MKEILVSFYKNINGDVFEVMDCLMALKVSNDFEKFMLLDEIGSEPFSMFYAFGMTSGIC